MEMKKYVNEEQLNELKNKCSSTVLITINPVIEGAEVILTSIDNLFQIKGKSDKDGMIILPIKDLATYILSFNDPAITTETKQIIIDKYGALFLIKAQYEKTMIYTVAIDLNNSNPETALVYEDDAVNIVSWESAPIFNHIKPCIFDNGEVKYYLQKNNFTMKEDGGAANITGIDGNVMIEFPQFGYRIYHRKTPLETTETEENGSLLVSTLDQLVIQITNNKNLNDDITFINNVLTSEEFFENEEGNICFYIVDTNFNKIFDNSGEYITTEKYLVDENGYLRNLSFPDFYIGNDFAIYDEYKHLLDIYYQDIDANGQIIQNYYNLIPPYRRYAFMDNNNNTKEKMYIGAYLATYNDDKTKLKSVLTTTSIISTANGKKPVLATYENHNTLCKNDGYKMWSIQQLIALQCLYIIKYKHLHSQKVLGNGYTGASSATTRVVGATALNGMYYGTTADKTSSVKFAGIEDFFGHYNQWVSEIGFDKEWNLYYDEGPLLGTYISTTLESDLSSIYLKNPIGTTESGFMVSTNTAGSSTTYYCDAVAIKNGTFVLNEDGATSGTLFRWAHGGSTNNSTRAGVFYIYGNTNTSTYATRLAYV